MRSSLARRLAKAEEAAEGGGKLWVVAGRTDADFSKEIDKLKSSSGAKEADLFVCLRRFAPAPH